MLLSQAFVLPCTMRALALRFLLDQTSSERNPRKLRIQFIFTIALTIFCFNARDFSLHRV